LILIRHLIEYLLIRVFATVVSSLGPKRATTIGRWLGDLLRLVDRRHRRVAEVNLARALPELDDAERGRILRESFRNLVCIGVELLFVPRLLTRGALRRHGRFEGLERFLGLVGERGAVVATAHHGNWEVMGALFGLVGLRLHSVARALDNPFLDRFLLRLRTRYGQQIIPKSGAMRQLVKTLRDGECLALVVDQDARAHGIFVPWFGHPASTIPTPAALAARMDVPIVAAVCVRDGNGVFSYAIRAVGPLRADPSLDREEEIRRLTAEINEALESFVREFPEQYLWQHRRWKSRPPEEKGQGGLYD
jgi:KDO2-lipid IV(A) lauroyltransferase